MPTITVDITSDDQEFAKRHIVPINAIMDILKEFVERGTDHNPGSGNFLVDFSVYLMQQVWQNAYELSSPMRITIEPIPGGDKIIVKGDRIYVPVQTKEGYDA